MRRLSVVDEIFLRTHQGLGTPIALQGLWRTAGAVEPEVLAQLHGALRSGPLARRVIRPRVPGARARWQRNDRAHRLDRHHTALMPAEIPYWADACGADLDPEHGPGWRLSAAPLTDGGTIVALTCSHVLADARGLILAVEQALEAVNPVRAVDIPRARPGTEPGGEVGGGSDSDWLDAARIWATVGLGGVRAAAARIPRGIRGPGTGRSAAGRPRVAPGAGGIPRTAHAPARLVAGPGLDRSARAERPAGYAARAAELEPVGPSGPAEISIHAPLNEPALIFRCPAAAWAAVAAKYGGTANSLFIWLVANTLWAAGFPGAEIAASLPVDTREEPGIDNDLAVTEITVAAGDGPAEIRAKSRSAYERRMTSPGGLPEEFLYLVPDKVAHLLSRGAGERDILCSNIGAIPSALSTLGPYECTGIATRAVHPGLDYARRPRTRLSGYLCRFGDDHVLTVASLYPEQVADAAALHRLVTATAARVDLPIQPW
ncbi:hypothetical protein [Nocardia grenadensis]|uniref:hypothetical protein n=1 Tax=Nocardia grenadensis TaxID=931537 RepID=UPI0007A3D557|nr:hypothetical protein [Nocardia grenadensis]